MTKIQRPRNFVCWNTLQVSIILRQKKISGYLFALYHKLEGLGDYVIGWVFWALAWFFHCPCGLVCRGPGFVGGMFLGLLEGLRGQCEGGFLGPCLVCPLSMGFGMPGPRVLGSFGYSLSILLYRSNLVEKVHIFMIIILRECFFRIVFPN